MNEAMGMKLEEGWTFWMIVGAITLFFVAVIAYATFASGRRTLHRSISSASSKYATTQADSEYNPVVISSAASMADETEAEAAAAAAAEEGIPDTPSRLTAAALMAAAASHGEEDEEDAVPKGRPHGKDPVVAEMSPEGYNPAYERAGTEGEGVRENPAFHAQSSNAATAPLLSAETVDALVYGGDIEEGMTIVIEAFRRVDKQKTGEVNKAEMLKELRADPALKPFMPLPARPSLDGSPDVTFADVLNELERRRLRRTVSLEEVFDLFKPRKPTGATSPATSPRKPDAAAATTSPATSPRKPDAAPDAAAAPPPPQAKAPGLSAFRAAVADVSSVTASFSAAPKPAETPRLASITAAATSQAETMRLLGIQDDEREQEEEEPSPSIARLTFDALKHLDSDDESDDGEALEEDSMDQDLSGFEDTDDGNS